MRGTIGIAVFASFLALLGNASALAQDQAAD